MPRVPLRNVHYLLCYAWDRLSDLGQLQARDVAAERPVDFFARLLRDGLRRRLRRGLDRGYVGLTEETARPRGKLLVAPTIARVLEPRGRVLCGLDEFSPDLPRNRVLKATARTLAAMPALRSTLRADLETLVVRMGDVSDVPVSDAQLTNQILHRGNADYGFLLRLCDLIRRCTLPDPDGTGKGFVDFVGSEQEMGHLFEQFVREFWKRELSGGSVHRSQLDWQGMASSDPGARWLPRMRTDVVLRSEQRTVVVEVKYTGTPYQEHYGQHKLRSDHLYQLTSYLRNFPPAPCAGEPRGLLLYAQAGASMRHDLRLGEHRVRVRSLDLNQDWRGIHRDLLALGGECLGLQPRHQGTESWLNAA